jgi:hypothetical protein
MDPEALKVATEYELVALDRAGKNARVSNVEAGPPPWTVAPIGVAVTGRTHDGAEDA